MINSFGVTCVNENNDICVTRRFENQLVLK